MNVRKSVLFVGANLLIAVAVGAILLTILYFWLHHYTQHGKEVDVPDVVGLYVEEAEPQVRAVGLRLQVTDSTYSTRVPLGTIVEQTPSARSHAKDGRTVYIVVNAKSRRQVPLPDLQDMSFRQAEATLRSVGIVVDEAYEYEPSEYKDLVLAVKQNGEVLAPGQRIDDGSRVTLVVGFGKGTEMVGVPNLVGLSLQNARSLLLSYRLTVGAVEYDAADTTAVEGMPARQVVYRQVPAAGEQLLEGSTVSLWLSADMEKAISAGSEESEEDFF